MELVEKEIGEVGLKRWSVELVCAGLEEEERVGDYLMERRIFIAK